MKTHFTRYVIWRLEKNEKRQNHYFINYRAIIYLSTGFTQNDTVWVSSLYYLDKGDFFKKTEAISSKVIVTQSLEISNRDLEPLRKKIGYPLLARDLGIGGSVIFAVKVNKEGKYQKHIILNSPDLLLSYACEKYISELKIDPPKWNEKSISGWVVIPFNFISEGGIGLNNYADGKLFQKEKNWKKAIKSFNHSIENQLNHLIKFIHIFKGVYVISTLESLIKQKKIFNLLLVMKLN